MPPSRVDVVVVGAGSCGCVVAARLSDDSERSVLLLDAGPGFGPSGPPPEIDDVATVPVGPSSPWTMSYPAGLTPSRTATISRGSGLGGSGAVNGAYFVRARPQDFDSWPSSWSYTEVLPHFRAIETDADFDGDEHGDAGPVPVTRMPRDRMHPVSSAFAEAADRAGFRSVDDLNASGPEGVGRVPLNVRKGIRFSTYHAYLRPVQHRANLTVRTGTRVLRVLVKAGRAVGVEVADDSGVHRIGADRVVLCAGAIGSAHLLMLSGIGGADNLRRAGIEVRADLPGVGDDFSDHPEIAVPYRYRRDLRGRAPVLETVLHTDHLEFRPYTAPFGVSIPGSGVTDPVLGVVLTEPRSRGRITLDGSDPRRAPRLDYRYLTHRADRDRLRRGVRTAAALLVDMDDVVDPSGLDPELRGAGAGAEVGVGDRWLIAHLGTSLHLSGTCRMGDDAGAVVDEWCRVRGIEGLSVVDTSVFPDVPSRGPHATAVMLAHRIAGRGVL